MESLSLAEWDARLSALHRRAEAVLALERAMVEYQAVGGGLPLPALCGEYPARGGKVKVADGRRKKKAA